jgi:hypothetical protein
VALATSLLLTFEGPAGDLPSTAAAGAKVSAAPKSKKRKSGFGSHKKEKHDADENDDYFGDDVFLRNLVIKARSVIVPGNNVYFRYKQCPWLFDSDDGSVSLQGNVVAPYVAAVIQAGICLRSAAGDDTGVLAVPLSVLLSWLSTYYKDLPDTTETDGARRRTRTLSIYERVDYILRNGEESVRDIVPSTHGAETTHDILLGFVCFYDPSNVYLAEDWNNYFVNGRSQPSNHQEKS